MARSSLELGAGGDTSVSPGVGADPLAFGRASEPVQVVDPVALVGVGGAVVEAPMDEPNQGGTVGLGGEVDLDGRPDDPGGPVPARASRAENIAAHASTSPGSSCSSSPVARARSPGGSTRP